jgi:flavin-binding protein dodecin
MLSTARVIGVSEESWEAAARGSSDRPESCVAQMSGRM